MKDPSEALRAKVPRILVALWAIMLATLALFAIAKTPTPATPMRTAITIIAIVLAAPAIGFLAYNMVAQRRAATLPMLSAILFAVTIACCAVIGFMNPATWVLALATSVLSLNRAYRRAATDHPRTSLARTHRQRPIGVVSRERLRLGFSQAFSLAGPLVT